MNKNKTLVVSGVLSLILAGSFFVNVGLADGTQPGSTGDPLVTKSYVDTKINEALGAGTVPVSTGVAADTYTPVNVKNGQVLVGGEGTEIILRSGNAVASCPGEDGIVNVTQGKDIGDGEKISTNNLLIVPRDDGRGVEAASDAWFMIKGDYVVLY